MKAKDITALVKTGSPDGESVPLVRCACGKTWERWDFILSIYPDMPRECDGCGRRMYAAVEVRVYEVTA